MGIGIFVLRLIVGLTVAAHGAQKLFGIFGGHGISGTARFVESLGFRPGRPYAYLLGFAELAGGLLLALGLLTPMATLAIVAVMTAAAVAVHLNNGFFVTNGGFEYPFVLAAAAAAIAIAGPGAYSLDALLDLTARGLAIGVGATLVGVALGLAVVALRNLPEKIGMGSAQTD